MLVDVQPEPAPLQLEVRLGERVFAAGVAHDAPFFHEDIASARRQLRALENRGELRLLRETRTTMRFTYDTVEGWSSFLTRPRAGPLEADHDLLRQGAFAIEEGTGAITAIVEHVGRAHRRSAH